MSTAVLVSTALAALLWTPSGSAWAASIAADVQATDQPTPAPAPRPRPTPPTPAAPAVPATPATPQTPVQARPGGPESDAPRTDQTVDVAKGTRLVLSSQAGEAIVRVWDRDAVRVQATHGTRDRVDLQTTDNTLRVRARSSRGPSGLVDFTLTVPRWMPVNLSGTYLAASIEGTSAEVNVETVGGDLTVKGGSGQVTLRSIEGEIRVDGATGKLQATTVNDSITLINVSGDVLAETTNGDVTIGGSRAASLEVSTVNGDVHFEGPTGDKGTYRISTHNGDIRVSLGQQANATVFVRTFGGDFTSDFPVTLPEGMSTRDGNKRFNFTLGSGGARVELESFQGDIRVTKGPLVSREQERRRRRGGVAPKGIGELAADIQREIESELDRELGPWRDRASTYLAPLAPAAPAAPPAPAPPAAPRAPRPPRP